MVLPVGCVRCAIYRAGRGPRGQVVAGMAISWAAITSTARRAARAPRAASRAARRAATRRRHLRPSARGTGRRTAPPEGQVRRAEDDRGPRRGHRDRRRREQRHRDRDQYGGGREVAQHGPEQDPARSRPNELADGAAAVQELLHVAAVAVQAPLGGAHARDSGSVSTATAETAEPAPTRRRHGNASRPAASRTGRGAAQLAWARREPPARSAGAGHGDGRSAGHDGRHHERQPQQPVHGCGRPASR